MNYQEALDYLKLLPKLKITLSGDIGSGKSTFGKRLSLAINVERIYIGQLMREEAKKKGMTLDDFNEFLKTDKSVDQDMDEAQRTKSKELDKAIFEGRTSWHFVENPDITIFLAVDPSVAAERVWGDTSNHLRDSYSSVEAIITANENRKQNEITRYDDLYKIDVYNKDNFDLVIDTSNTGIDETFENGVISIAETVKNS